MEFDGALEQLGFLGVHAALLLGFLHDGHQLVGGKAGVFLRLHKQRKQLLPLGKQPVDGFEQRYQQTDEGCNEHSKAFGRFLGQAFGRDLTENQDDDGDHRSGNSRARIAVADEGDKEQRGNRRKRNVDHVVAHQNGGEQFIIAFRKRKRVFGAFVAVIRHVFQTRAVQRGESRLRGREKSRQRHKNDHQNQLGSVTGHGWGILLLNCNTNRPFSSGLPPCQRPAGFDGERMKQQTDGLFPDRHAKQECS